MPRPPAYLPCPNCEGCATRIIEQDPDPEPPDGRGTVLRVRECLDCGTLIGSREELAPLEAVRHRLAELAGERRYDLRAVRKALATGGAGR